VTFCANLLRLSKISWHVKVNQVYTCVKLGSLCLIACKPSCIDGPNRPQAILKQRLAVTGKFPLFAQRKSKNNRTSVMRTRSTQLLCLRSGANSPEHRFPCSGLGLLSGLPLLPASTAIKHLDCAPSSLSKQFTVSQLSRPNHPAVCSLIEARPPNRCRGAKQYFSCLLTIAYFAVMCKPASK